jgi:ATP/maltotriose-dependent transcriptional regulator MalT
MAIDSRSITSLHTKLHRPTVVPYLICRESLHDKLDAARHLPLTLVSAPAGYGKSTLIAHWLETSQFPSAWLSLDKDDSDIRNFISYTLAAVRTLFPEACRKTERLLNIGDPPSIETLATCLCNDLSIVDTHFILALDDYHQVRGHAVQELLSELLKHPPQTMHLVIMTRRNPRLPFVTLKAKQRMMEIRVQALQFNLQETTSFLKNAVGIPLEPADIKKLHEATEGWPVALRLTALAISHHANASQFIDGFIEQSPQVQEYLILEILARLTPIMREWLCKTAILDRFCASLCEAVCGSDASLENETLTGAEFIAELRRIGLPCVPLDIRQHWFRYHHLLQETLRHQLGEIYRPSEISSTYQRASLWFENQGLLDEALHYHLENGKVSEASQLIVRNRKQIFDQEIWYSLNRWLKKFPPSVLDNDPELLILEAWSLHSRGRDAEIFPFLDQIETLLSGKLPKDMDTERIRGEVDIFRSYQSYIKGDSRLALSRAKRAYKGLSLKDRGLRSYAVIFLAAAMQMNGRLPEARQVIFDVLMSDRQLKTKYHGRLMLALSFVSWIAADLSELRQASDTMLKIGVDGRLPEVIAYARYFRGISNYHRNQLDAAEKELTSEVENPSYPSIVNHLRCEYALALTYEAKGERSRANKLLTSAIGRMLEAGNVGLLTMSKAFEAELAIRQGQLSKAVKWLGIYQLGQPSAGYGLFAPELTAVKTLIAQKSVTSWNRAEIILGKMHDFFSATHNTRFLIETLALRAMLHNARGNEKSALSNFEQSLQLALPGRFIRLFVDLGPEAEKLLYEMDLKDEAIDYVKQIILACDKPSNRKIPNFGDSHEQLTRREIEVLGLLNQHLPNKNIADQLCISLDTVKTHTKHIYQKLSVRNRREAVTKAHQLGLVQ